MQAVRRWLLAWAWAWACSWSLLHAATAHAHPLIDQARARLEAAEFERALALLDKAEESGELGRADALRLLELRALGLLALNDERRAQRVLIELCALDPEHAFTPGTSPDLLAAFERARTRVPPAPRLLVERRDQPDGVALEVHVIGDELGLVRRVVLSTRTADGPWRAFDGDHVQLALAPGQQVQFRASARGLGGTELASAPEQSWRRPEPAPVREPLRASKLSPWVYVGIAAGVLVVAGTTTAVVLSNTGDADRTQPSPPRVVR